MRNVEPRPGRFDAGHRTRIVQRCQGNQVADLLDRSVVDDHRIGEVRPAVHDPVPDRPEPDRVKINTGFG